MRYGQEMRPLNRSTVREFWTQHPQAKSPLQTWLKLIELGKYSGVADLRKTFPSADLAGPNNKYTIFNIGGNDFRLICIIEYISKRCYIRGLFTHAEYDSKQTRRLINKGSL